MRGITVSEAVKELGLEKESFEKYHRMTLGIASYSNFYPVNKTLKSLNGGKYIMPPFVLLILAVGFAGGIFLPVAIMLLNHLTGKKLTKLLKEYCIASNINVEIDDTRGNLLYVRNKMIDIAKLEARA